KALPVASWTARTVTPGRRAPDESVILPLTTASSCAWAMTGRSRIVDASTNRARPDLIATSSRDELRSAIGFAGPRRPARSVTTGRVRVLYCSGAILGAVISAVNEGL